MYMEDRDSSCTVYSGYSHSHSIPFVNVYIYASAAFDCED